MRWLEQLTHPMVAKDLRRKIESAATGSVVVCEVPLLFEAGYEGLFDLLVTVEARSDNPPDALGSRLRPGPIH